MCDTTFYGLVPPNMTRNEAVHFLAKGVSNYLKVRASKMPRELAISMLDMWMEHDACQRSPKFDYLFEDDDGEVESDCLENIVDEAYKMTDLSGKPEYSEDDNELDEYLVGPYPNERP